MGATDCKKTFEKYEEPRQIPFWTLKYRRNLLWLDFDSLSIAHARNSSQNTTVHSITHYGLQFTERFSDLSSLLLIFRADLMTHWWLSL